VAKYFATLTIGPPKFLFILKKIYIFIFADEQKDRREKKS
jgi:hypothetical protein